VFRVGRERQRPQALDVFDDEPVGGGAVARGDGVDGGGDGDERRVGLDGAEDVAARLFEFTFGSGPVGEDGELHHLRLAAEFARDEFREFPGEGFIARRELEDAAAHHGARGVFGRRRLEPRADCAPAHLPPVNLFGEGLLGRLAQKLLRPLAVERRGE
jgi:hypothetical protein